MKYLEHVDLERPMAQFLRQPRSEVNLTVRLQVRHELIFTKSLLFCYDAIFIYA